MSHRVHPKIFRVGINNDWKSKGFYGKNFPKHLEEDFIIRNFLNKRMDDTGVKEIEIKRSPTELSVVIHSSRPGLIIGRGGEGIKKIKEDLEKRLKRKKIDLEKKLKIEVKEVKDPWSSASVAAKEIAKQLEKRMHYRRVVKQAMSKIMANKNVKGARVEVAGRLNGIEIARTEHMQEGNLPRHTIRADMDYAFEEAYCKFGAIGIKILIYKGEKFKEDYAGTKES